MFASQRLKNAPKALNLLDNIRNWEGVSTAGGIARRDDLPLLSEPVFRNIRYIHFKYYFHNLDVVSLYLEG